MAIGNWRDLRDEVRRLEALARAVGFRMPRLDETLENYNRALTAHLGIIPPVDARPWYTLH